MLSLFTMKKTYQTPHYKVCKIDPQAFIAQSNEAKIKYTNSNADESKEVLVKQQNMWDEW